MTVREGQRAGGLTILIVSTAVYGVSLFYHSHPRPDSPLPWGDQVSGRIAIEVAGNRGADGIYFIPEAKAAAELSKITGYDAPTVDGALAKARFSSASAILVFAEGGVLKIIENGWPLRLFSYGSREEDSRGLRISRPFRGSRKRNCETSKNT